MHNVRIFVKQRQQEIAKKVERSEQFDVGRSFDKHHCRPGTTLCHPTRRWKISYKPKRSHVEQRAAAGVCSHLKAILAGRKPSQLKMMIIVQEVRAKQWSLTSWLIHLSERLAKTATSCVAETLIRGTTDLEWDYWWYIPVIPQTEKSVWLVPSYSLLVCICTRLPYSLITTNFG